MAWQAPKTNWYGATDSDGNYSGDKFNAADFNRIKNNLIYLQELASELYKEFSINDLGEDRTAADYFYADEINDLEENLDTINSNSLNREYGNAPVYIDNGKTITFDELNRIESASLDLYNKLTNQYKGRRKLTFMLGAKEDF